MKLSKTINFLLSGVLIATPVVSLSSCGKSAPIAPKDLNLECDTSVLQPIVDEDGYYQPAYTVTSTTEKADLSIEYKIENNSRELTINSDTGKISWGHLAYDNFSIQIYVISRLDQDIFSEKINIDVQVNWAEPTSLNLSYTGGYNFDGYLNIPNHSTNKIEHSIAPENANQNLPITWKVIKESGSQSFGQNIYVQNGLICWTDNLSLGTYKFKVQAEITDYSISKILDKAFTLNINYQDVTSFNLSYSNTNLIGMVNTAGEDTGSWTVNIQPEFANQSVTYGISQTDDQNVIIDENTGKISWGMFDLPTESPIKFSVVGTTVGLPNISKTIDFQLSILRPNPTSVTVKYNNSTESPTIIGYVGEATTTDEKYFSATVEPSDAYQDVVFSISGADGLPVSIGGQANNQLVFGPFESANRYTFKVIATACDNTTKGEINVTLNIQLPNPTKVELSYSEDSTNLTAYIEDTTKSIGKVSSQVTPSYAHSEVTYSIKNNDSTVDIKIDEQGYISWPKFQTPTTTLISFDVIGTSTYGQIESNPLHFTLNAIYADAQSVEIKYSNESSTNLVGYINESGDSGDDYLSSAVSPSNADQTVVWNIQVDEQYQDAIKINETTGKITWSAFDATIDSIPFIVSAWPVSQPSKVSNVINFNLTITRKKPTKIEISYEGTRDMTTPIISGTKSEYPLTIDFEPSECFTNFEWKVQNIDQSTYPISIDENNYITWSPFTNINKSLSFGIYAESTVNHLKSETIQFTLTPIYQPATTVQISWLGSQTNKGDLSGPVGRLNTFDGLSAVVLPSPGADQSITWSISNTTNFAINSTTGEITALNNILLGATLNFTVTAKSNANQTKYATKEFTYTSTSANVIPYSDFQINSSGVLTSWAPDVDPTQLDYSELQYPADVTAVGAEIIKDLNENPNNLVENVTFSKNSKLTNAHWTVPCNCLTVDYSNCLNLEMITEICYRPDLDYIVKLKTLILPVNIKYFTGLSIKVCRDLNEIIWDGNNQTTSCGLNFHNTDTTLNPTGSDFQFTSQNWIHDSTSTSYPGSFMVRNTRSTYSSSNLKAVFYGAGIQYMQCFQNNNYWVAK